MGQALYSIDGKKLSALRRAAFLTQEGLAKRSGVSLSRIKQIERGRATPVRGDTLTKLATGVSSTPEVLMGPTGAEEAAS